MPARRPSATQQWQTAIEQQRQREAVAPSKGEQIADIINWNITRGIHGNPLAMIAQMYQDMRSGKLSAGTPQGAQRSARTSLALLSEGMLSGPKGKLGMTGAHMTSMPGSNVMEYMRARQMMDAYKSGRITMEELHKGIEPMLSVGDEAAEQLLREYIDLVNPANRT